MESTTHKYALMSPEELEKHFSNFLINSWSYSKLTTFSRNEKAFEMAYIYGLYGKSSSTTVAGQAYHYALDLYFSSLKDGEVLDLPTLERIAFNYIEEKPAYIWKLQKTTPSVEDCVIKATKTTAQALQNFVKEVGVYMDEIEEILFVEVNCDEFLTINGVEIPLPCHARIDLVARLKSGENVVIDHKLKSIFSNENEARLSGGVQAITYVKCLEAKYGIEIHQAWFVENKYSMNRDKSPQLSAFKITVDVDTRALYEQILYEPIRRLVTAVNDPDYVYLINDADNYVDKEEVYEFWARTQVAEIEDFNVDPSKKEIVSKRLKKIRDASVKMVNPKVIRDFKKFASEFIQYDFSNKDMTQQEKIEHALRHFSTIAKVAHSFDGYSSNTHLLEISAGTKVASIKNHRMDIANALDVASVRISNDLVVYDGKSYVSIEISKKRDKDLIFNPKDLQGMKIPIGKDNLGRTIIWDLDGHATTNVLVCGSVGSGKSVMIDSTIEYAKLAKVNEILILDPKYEFTNKKGATVVNEIIDIENKMAEMVVLMNEMIKAGQKRKILIVFDEFADALSQSRSGNELKIYENVVIGEYKNGLAKTKRECVGELKSLEENLKILAQKGRSTGFRIIAATQRASVKIITGDTKVNFPVQVCFRVPKEVDSKVVIDEAGAESLGGQGDGLINSPEYTEIVRFQAYYKPN